MLYLCILHSENVAVNYQRASVNSVISDVSYIHTFVLKKLHKEGSCISEGRDHESFTEAKPLFVPKRIVKIGISCDGMFFDVQYCPWEIFAIKKP